MRPRGWFGNTRGSENEKERRKSGSESTRGVLKRVLSIIEITGRTWGLHNSIPLACGLWWAGLRCCYGGCTLGIYAHAFAIRMASRVTSREHSDTNCEIFQPLSLSLSFSLFFSLSLSLCLCLSLSLSLTHTHASLASLQQSFTPAATSRPILVYPRVGISHSYIWTTKTRLADRDQPLSTPR